VTCAIRANFKLLCWGITSFVPKHLSSYVNSITAGGRHTCSMQSGTVNCWGSNEYMGKLPHKIKDDVWSIKAGWDFNCAISLSNSILCYGFN